MSTPLTFGELKEGDKFIGFPIDGDDSGHGGYREGSNIFIKLRMSEGKGGENSVRQCDGTLSRMPDSMQVLKLF